MQPTTRSRAAEKHKPRAAALVAWLVGCGLFFFASAIRAEEPPGRWHLVVEPAFMRPEFATPVAGSQKTVVAPAIIRGDTVTYLTKEIMDRLGVKLDSIDRVARRNASEELSKLEPRYIRDRRGIVQAAIVDSDRPVVASTVLAPDFVARFEDVLGPDLLVAIPNRYRIYVFPALASEFQSAADAILADYQMTPYPVSKEVFRVERSGIQAVGTFDPEPVRVP